MTMNPLRRALPAVTAALLATACLLGAPTDAAAQSRPMMYTDRWTDADTAFLFRVLDDLGGLGAHVELAFELQFPAA